MSMLNTFATIKLSLVRSSSTYTEARPRHDALAAYETPAAVHHALRHDSSAVMEGVLWTGIREQMNRMKPVYDVAILSDPSLAQKYPQLTRLLEAKTAIAKKAVSTRRANKLLVQAGKMPTLGAAGKKRKRAADKAALAELAAQKAATVGTSTPTASTTPHATQTVAPAPQPAAASVIVPAPAQAATPAPVVNGANGSNGSSVNGANGVNGAAQHS